MASPRTKEWSLKAENTCFDVDDYASPSLRDTIRLAVTRGEPCRSTFRCNNPTIDKRRDVKEWKNCKFYGQGKPRSFVCSFCTRFMGVLRNAVYTGDGTYPTHWPRTLSGSRNEVVNRICSNIEVTNSRLVSDYFNKLQRQRGTRFLAFRPWRSNNITDVLIVDVNNDNRFVEHLSILIFLFICVSYFFLGKLYKMFVVDCFASCVFSSNTSLHFE